METCKLPPVFSLSHYFYCATRPKNFFMEKQVGETQELWLLDRGLIIDDGYYKGTVYLLD